MKKDKVYKKYTNKNDIKEALRKTQVELSDEEVDALVDSFIESMVKLFKNKEEFELPKIGKFSIIRRKEVMRRNVVTGEPVLVPERNAIKFKSNVIIRKIINEEGRF